MPLRRRGVPQLPALVLDAFRATVDRVERAKAALVAAVPSPRGIPTTPLAEGLQSFEAELREAAMALPRWRAPETEALWERCGAALDRAGEAAERLRLEAPDLDYEGLVEALGELLDPLTAFEDAERALDR